MTLLMPIIQSITILEYNPHTDNYTKQSLPFYSCRTHTEPMIQDNKDESSVKRPLFSRKEIVH
jgi:hypothetical protein